MSSLNTDEDIRRTAGELGIDEAELRAALVADHGKRVEFVAGLAKSGHFAETVARSLGITDDEISDEISRQGSISFQRYLLENPPS